MVYDWLVNLSEWWQIPLATGTVGLFSLAVTAMFRRVTETRRRESLNDVMGLVFGACAIMYAVLLGFVILNVYNQYQRADRITTREAATLVTLYLDTERYPDPPRPAMQQAIRQYTRSVVDDEFQSMRRGEPSPATGARLDQLYVLNVNLHSGDPNFVELNSEFNRQIDSTAQLREERIRLARTTLPWTLWFVLMLASIVTIVMAASLFMQPVSHQLFGSFLLGAMVGALLFVVLLLDRPFTGTTAISPEAFQRSLQAYTLIDKVHRQPPARAVSSAAAAPRPAARAHA
jgi:hypothetical protein